MYHDKGTPPKKGGGSSFYRSFGLPPIHPPPSGKSENPAHQRHIILTILFGNKLQVTCSLGSPFISINKRAFGLQLKCLLVENNGEVSQHDILFKNKNMSFNGRKTRINLFEHKPYIKTRKHLTTVFINRK